jgi:hypothetical protein
LRFCTYTPSPCVAWEAYGALRGVTRQVPRPGPDGEYLGWGLRRVFDWEVMGVAWEAYTGPGPVPPSPGR